MKLLRKTAIFSEEMPNHSHLGLFHEREDCTTEVIECELEPLFQHVPETTSTISVYRN
jgi:hypothetical protein